MRLLVVSPLVALAVDRVAGAGAEVPRAITVKCINPGPNDTGYVDDQTGTSTSTTAANPAARWSTLDPSSRAPSQPRC